MFKKILIPLDGSDVAEAVIPFAQEIATTAGAELVFVTAVEQVGVWDATLSLQVLDRESQAARAYLEKVKTSVADGVSARSKIVEGDAADAILAAAEEERVDLIALSTHGRSGLSRWLFGSVATRILEHAEVPTLFLRPKEGEDKGAPGPVVKKILIPLDGSDVADSILPVVEEFARLMGASLAFYNAVQPLSVYPGFEAAGASALGDIVEETQKQARQMLSRAANEAKSHGLEATIAVNLGTAVDGILHAGDDLNVDLIAISTHGRGGLGRVVLGSVADGVVRRSADIPCLVVRPKG